MADFVSAPQVVDENDIILYGNHYKLGGPIQVVMHTTPPPKIRIGDKGADDNARVSSYTWNDLRGGGGLWQIEDLVGDRMRFWEATPMNTLWPNQIGVIGVDTVVTGPAGAGSGERPQAYMQLDATSNQLAVFGAETYNYSGSAWSALIDTLPGTVVYDTIFYNGAVTGPALFIALGSSGYNYVTDVAVAGTDVASGTLSPIAWAVWDNKLWALDTAGVLKTSITGTTWDIHATVPAQFTNKASLKVFPNADGDATLWVITPSGVWIYDATSNVWTESGFQYPRYVKAASSGNQLAVVYRNGLYVNCGLRKLVELRWVSGALVATDVSPLSPNGSSQVSMTIGCMAADGDLLYVALHVTTYLYVMAYNGAGWHWVGYKSGTYSGAGNQVLTILNHDTIGHFLWAGTALSDTVQALVGTNLTQLSEPPLYSSISSAANVQSITLPYFGGANISSNKLGLKVRVKAAALPSGSITVAYRINGSAGSFTTLGTITNTTDTALWFGTSNVGLNFRTIQLKFTPTDTVLIIMGYIVLEYLELPEVLRGFILDLDMSRDYMGQSPRVMIDNLWGALGTATLGTFGYHDDAGNTRSYLVHAEKPEGLENTTTGNEQGKYRVLLLAMRDND